jgi:hypothetical protein
MLRSPVDERRALLTHCVADAGLDHLFVADHVASSTGAA